ncbi:hypothetical protein QL285_046000 [Trifolium repens]|nr:hypothetical protein QL285_046000 [Trifolium repens]
MRISVLRPTWIGCRSGSRSNRSNQPIRSGFHNLATQYQFTDLNSHCSKFEPFIYNGTVQILNCDLNTDGADLLQCMLLQDQICILNLLTFTKRVFGLTLVRIEFGRIEFDKIDFE